MTDLISQPLGYKHEPQDAALVEKSEFAAIIVRIKMVAQDKNGGTLDSRLRMLSAVPQIGDTFSTIGDYLYDPIQVEIIGITKQNEQQVAKSGGPLYIVHCKSL